MSSSTSRRVGATALAAVLAGGVLLAAPAPAHAAVLGTTALVTQVSFDDHPDVGVTCTHTGPGDVSTPPATFAADGVPVSRTSSSSAVITDNANASDKTTMTGSVTHTITANQANGQLSSVHLVSTSSATLATAIANTKCGADVSVGGGSQFQFDLVSPALVTITAEAHRMVGIVEVGNITSSSPSDVNAAVVYALGTHGVSTGSLVLPAGTSYIGVNQVQGGLEAPNTASSLSTSGDVTVDIAFDVPGSATAAQSGSGAKYVDLAAGRDCAGGKLSMTWTKKAGKGKNRVIKKAIVRVNGAKVATIKKPKKNQVSTISGLTAEKTADVEVTLKVKGEGKSTVDRSYRRCA